jgi:hypothetical protein
MLFVYKPEGIDPLKWEFDADKLLSPEAEAIEKHTGMTYGEWKRAVVDESVRALHGLLYVMLKRKNATLKWDEVEFSMSEVDFELDDDEAAEAVTNLEARAVVGDGLTPQEVALLEALRVQVEGSVREVPKETPSPTPTDDASTDGGSTESTESLPGTSTD